MSSDSCRKVSRGQVWFLVDNDVPAVHMQGSIQGKNRPWLVVSNNKCNQSSPVYTIVPLTTSPKNELPTHVTFQTGDKTQTVLCEQIRSVAQQVFFNSGSHYMWTMSEKYMRMVDEALAIQLGLSLIFPKSEQFWESLERLIRTRVKEAIDDSRVQAIDISKIASLLDAKVEEAVKEETQPVAEPEPEKKEEIHSGSKPWNEMPHVTSYAEPKNEENKAAKPRNKWTKESMQTFLDDFDKYATDIMLKKYNMTLKTLYVTRSKFRRLVQKQ